MPIAVVGNANRMDSAEINFKWTAKRALSAVHRARAGLCDEVDSRNMDYLLSQYLVPVSDLWDYSQTEQGQADAREIWRRFNEIGQKAYVVVDYAEGFFDVDNFMASFRELVCYMRRHGLAKRPHSAKHQQMVEFLEYCTRIQSISTYRGYCFG